MNKIAKVARFLRDFLIQVGPYCVGRQRFRLVAAVWLLIVSSYAVKAQTGQKPYVAPEPVELGFVESATGSLHLEIGLGSFPERPSGRSGRYYLAYDSNIWSVSPSNVWQPSGFPFYTGWRTVTSNSLGIYLTQSVIANCFIYYQNFNWIDPLGIGHFFPVTTISSCGSGGTPSGDALAADSSGYHMYVTNYTNAIVYGPDGTIVVQSPAVTDASGKTVDIKDANGNYLSHSGPDAFNPSGIFVDTLGRQVLQGDISVPKSQGQGTFQVVRTSIPVKTQFGQSGVTECTTNCTVAVYSAIALPDNTQYQFKYDCDSSTGNAACGSPTGQSAYYGTLISVTLPTGGQITYGYTTFTDSYGNKSRWLNTRSSAGGTWFYTPQVLSTCSSSQVGCQEKVTASKPSGASTTYTFTLNNGAWPVQVQSSSDALGNSIEAVTNTFDFSNSCVLANCIGASYIRLLSRVTTLSVPGGTSLSKKIALTYDTPQKGNVTALKEWKFYPGTNPTYPSVPDRATYITYASPGTNIINKPASSTLCNNSGSDADCPGGGSKVSQTKFTYDSYGTNLCGGGNGLVSVTGIANHDDAGFGAGNLARGNPTQIQRWVSGTTFLSTSLLYDTTGQVIQNVNPAGNLTCYIYADNFFSENGPSSMTPYTPPAPTNAYPKTVTVGGLTSTFGYYFGSGKLAFSTDPNNTTTSYFFSDLQDRPTQTVYPIGWKLANYTSATQADSYVAVADTSASSSCTSCQHNQINLDAWGRKTNQKLVNAPGGAINVDTTYDLMGRVQSVSHAYVSTSDPSHVFETFSYDGTDRKTATTHPDGQVLQTTFGAPVSAYGGISSQQGSPTTYGYGYPVLATDENGNQRQEWLDGFGQVVEVNETSITSSAHGTGTVTIGGFEKSQNQCDPSCDPTCRTRSCSFTVWDAGTVYVTVGGMTKAASYGQGSNSGAIASTLVGYFNADGASPVTASLNGSVITFTGKNTDNYPLSASVHSSHGFNPPSFSATPSGSTLTGGAGGISSSPFFTNYIYDAAGNLTQVIQGVQTRTLAYDGLGRLTSMTTPEAGTDNFYFTQSDNVSLCAGSPKAVCRKTDARGITTTYTYNSLSQLTGKAYSNTSLMPNVCTTVPNGTPANVCNYYGQGGAAAFALGRLTSMVDPSGSETFTYDPGGRVTQKQKVIGTTPYPIQYQYNAGAELTQITYPSGRVVTQTPDSIGRLNTLTSGLSSSPTYVYAVPTFNSAGQITILNYGNGSTGNFTYSAARQQLTSVSYTSGVSPFPTILSLNYGYQNGQANCGTSTTTGNDGLIQCIQDSSGTAEAGRSVIYSYDALGRLNTATTTGSSGYAQWGLSWVYDRYGNRVSQNQTAGSPPMNSLTFATMPIPPSTPPGGAYTNRPDGYSFDASGNMLNDGQNTLTYDAENCLTSSGNSGFGTTMYACDSYGIRVKKALQGSITTVYIFSGGKDIAEYDNGAAVSSPSREYIYLGGQLLATLQGGTLTYHHSDHLSVRLSTDGTSTSPTYRQKIGEQGHYPYGEQWYATNTTTKFFFTSYERDSESGNDYAMARFYINRFGRFSCVDPSLGSPSDPQSWNRYAYARNNPVNITDPSGQFWLFKLLGALLAFIGILLEPVSAGASTALIHLGMSLAGVGFATPGSFGNAPGTPPTFPDPLGNTQATLNSIYSPISLSKFATPPFFDPGGSTVFDFEAWKQAVGDCAQTKMGVEMKSFDPSSAGHNGKFVGWGADTLSNGGNDATITVVNNVNRFSVSDLSEINISTNVHGWTPRKERRWLPGGPWYGEKVSPYENYTAYDFA